MLYRLSYGLLVATIWITPVLESNGWTPSSLGTDARRGPAVELQLSENRASRNPEALAKVSPKSGPERGSAMQSETLRTSRLRYLPRLLLLIPFAALIWVPSYNRLEPEFAGVPFFYWYQLALILIGAALVVLVYLLEMRLTRRT
jgi:hypothetical protein